MGFNSLKCRLVVTSNNIIGRGRDRIEVNGSGASGCFGFGSGKIGGRRKGRMGMTRMDGDFIVVGK
ncbi:hypothetical protein, partial [Staphylococcus epidermidis]|uniref:hypothetical protein n=1 Tax=Staphylococcus epidermidis TaxID=1282 RepID=UPI0011A5771F